MNACQCRDSTSQSLELRTRLEVLERGRMKRYLDGEELVDLQVYSPTPKDMYES